MPLFSQESHQEQSHTLFQKAYACQMKGELEKAIRFYQRSIDLFPTAEAHTFLGWTYSYQERYQEAIDECLRAIVLDPDYGNPYNDIGSYLLQLNQPEEAIVWFQRAIEAPRYESRVFAWFNLGKVAELKYDQHLARNCYSRAMEADPAYLPAWQAYVRVCASLN
jgi:Tfp pilus assembly protein PilF